MSKTERLHQFIKLLRQQRRITLAELMQELEVSRATVMRDLEWLRVELGHPIHWDRDTRCHRNHRSRCEADVACHRDLVAHIHPPNLGTYDVHCRVGSEPEGNTAMSEIHFFAEESPQGGYEARAASHETVSEAEALPELRAMVCDAVRSHFDESHVPSLIRLHFSREETLAV